MSKFKKILKLTAVAVTSILLYSKFIEPNTLVLEERSINTHKLTSEETIKIAHISDIHLGEFTSIEMLIKVKDKINNLNCDIVVLTGDLFDNTHKQGVDYTKVSAILKDINAPMGKFAVSGNHEHRHGAMEIYSNVLKTSEFNLLINENIALNNNITIVGIDDLYNGNGDINTAFLSTDANSFNITLCHEPDFADVIANHNTDIILSGHSHWGQVNLPFISEIVYPPYSVKYPKGSNDVNGKILITNKGIGTTKLPLRFLAPPTIGVYTIKGM